ncbi:Cytoplasmic tRNA 2-thiolation protein 2 [Coemansia brasiliensis]|uniref:Cytoplasmic tRNA 2-thiolation protein 2 n=1 Tax=Coemansia brasiliensis TaxID=2650707 RepID=A0A9W8I8W0_9FUNG|nr:Cytoplasmic tRNA 2-thiolation protein 2 [Coemansia brasiliensis]
MCDTSTLDISAAAEAPSRRKAVPGKCIKCKAAKPNVAIRRIQYCRQCFVKASVTKFRMAVGKSRKRVAWPRTKVLIAFSGGPSSSAMLRLAADLQNMELKGTDAMPPFLGAVVGHIDESCLFPSCPESNICAIAANSGIQLETLALEHVFLPTEDHLALLELVQTALAPGAAKEQLCVRLSKPAKDASCAEQLQTLFSNLKSPTDKEDMLQAIKTALLVQLARNSGCGAILLGDSATRTAVKAMALTGRGRGFSLPLEVGAESQWFQDIVAIRPMRDFVAKEIAFFNRWTRQPSAFVPTFTTAEHRRASINRLTEAFIVELDQDFASTVPTVCRTLQKLETRPDALAAAPCLVCGMPAEPDAHTWRTRLTIDSNVPESTPDTSENDTFDITSCLCYSCQTMLRHTAPGAQLPGFCSSRLHAAAAGSSLVSENQDRLRKQIENFIISDSDSDDN